MKLTGTSVFFFAVFSRIIFGVTAGDFDKEVVVCTLYETGNVETGFDYRLKTSYEELSVMRISPDGLPPDAKLANEAFDLLKARALDLVKSGICGFINYAIPMRINSFKVSASNNNNILTWNYFPRNLNSDPKFTVFRRVEIFGKDVVLATGISATIYTDENPIYSRYKYTVKAAGTESGQSIVTPQPSYTTAVAIYRDSILYVYSSIANDRLGLVKNYFNAEVTGLTLKETKTPDLIFAPLENWKTIVGWKVTLSQIYSGNPRSDFLELLFPSGEKKAAVIRRYYEGTESATFHVPIMK
jgi:hypothetical protein